MIFGLAGHPREMPYRHLPVRTAVLKQHKRRQETVHSLEHRYTFGYIGMENLERASRIGGPVVGHHFPEAIGNLGLYSLEEGILTVGADAYHHALFLNAFKQKIEILRCSLQIGIHITHEIRVCIVETGFDGCAQSGIFHKTDIIQVLAACADFLNAVQATVR